MYGFPDPEKFFSHFKNLVDDFSVIRNGEEISQVKGTINHKELSIRTHSQFNILPNDILFHIASRTNYYVKTAFMKTINNKNYGYDITYVLSPEELLAKEPKEEKAVFNIGSIGNNAIIGTQSIATIIAQNSASASLEQLKELINSKPAEDKELLNKLLSRLEIIEEDNQPVSKGTLAKFSDLLAKHSDVAIAVGSFFTKLLTASS